MKSLEYVHTNGYIRFNDPTNKQRTGKQRFNSDSGFVKMFTRHRSSFSIQYLKKQNKVLIAHVVYICFS